MRCRTAMRCSKESTVGYARCDKIIFLRAESSRCFNSPELKQNLKQAYCPYAAPTRNSTRNEKRALVWEMETSEDIPEDITREDSLRVQVTGGAVPSNCRNAPPGRLLWRLVGVSLAVSRQQAIPDIFALSEHCGWSLFDPTS